MGDRGNIVIRQAADNSNDVWFYTHWTGSDIVYTVRKALRRKQRWSDGPYLARMIFCEMVKGQETEETGFGIGCEMLDNEHDIIVVDAEKQRVFTVKQSELSKRRLKNELEGGLTFEEFIK